MATSNVADVSPSHNPSSYIHRLDASHYLIYRCMRLRLLTDAPQLFGSNYAREAAFSTETWVKRLENPLSAVWVATPTPAMATFVGIDEDAAAKHYIGTIGCIGGFPPDPSHAWIAGMWVAPEARGRGVASELVKAAVAWARDIKREDGRRAFTTLTLTCNEENVAARTLYVRSGFAEVEDEEEAAKGHVAMRCRDF
ncbi:acyl-CoA N-acyltransferase [Exidia glandulosa HHB12029]|uniref:Acyl-CoA N-acyltransferase n=1 Tax=Exidia glandulosa HHB12029 TaxID=1314781 RepID=A0A165HUS5_EXIGL|nr:acyl-CoA N-acyltransferase [Exidia glandulosa HHB12029]